MSLSGMTGQKKMGRFVITSYVLSYGLSGSEKGDPVPVKSYLEFPVKYCPRCGKKYRQRFKYEVVNEFLPKKACNICQK